MCHDGDSFNRFRAVVAPSKEQMIAEGFSAFAVEDFYDSFMEQLDKLSPNTNDNISNASAHVEANGSNGEKAGNGAGSSNCGSRSKLGIYNQYVYIYIIRAINLYNFLIL